MTALFSAVPPNVMRLGQLAVTLGLFALLWRAVDGPQVLALLGQVQPGWLIAAVGVLILQTALSAWRWRITAGKLGQSLSQGRALREYFLSQVVNQALPGAVMGDAARAVRARAGVGLGVSGLAVALERLAGQIMMALVLLLSLWGTLLWPGGLDWSPAARTGIYTVTLGLGVLTAVCAFGSLNMRAPDWIRPAAQALFAPDILPRQFGLGAGIVLCNLTAFALCAFAVGASLTAGAVFALIPLILFAMLIPLTISGWGVREGAAAALLPLAGVPPTDAVAASVLFGIAILLSALPGLIVLGMK